VIIIPDGAPRPSTDYGGAWSSLSKRTKLLLLALIPLPAMAGAAALFLQDEWFTYTAVAFAFAVWGTIGSYLGFISDNRRLRRMREKPQFRPLADAEISESERLDAVYESQRKAAIEAMKRRRQP
jgi:hypothetical protein